MGLAGSRHPTRLLPTRRQIFRGASLAERQAPLRKEKKMIGNESWRISIENSADFIKKNIGVGTVQAVFEKYGATSPDDLSPAYYSEVFSELYAIEADLRD